MLGVDGDGDIDDGDVEDGLWALAGGDGTKCEVITLEKDKLLPLTHNFLEDSQYPYYPGQRVKVNTSTASKPARWLGGTWKDNHDEGTSSLLNFSGS